MKHLGVAAAGALGALTRYWIGAAVGTVGFPWPTLGINLVGSFLLGVLLGVAPGQWNTTLTTTLAIGFLGAFTTFSTFAFETQSMLRSGRAVAALAYVALSIVIGVAAAAAGYAATRAAG